MGHRVMSHTGDPICSRPRPQIPTMVNVGLLQLPDSEPDPQAKAIMTT